jgi:hypothetical protein
MHPRTFMHAAALVITDDKSGELLQLTPAS